MAKKEKMEEEVSVPKTTKVLVSAPRHKVYTFEQWAQLRGKPARHLSGMKAFLGSSANNKYSLDVWDTMLKAY